MPLGLTVPAVSEEVGRTRRLLRKAVSEFTIPRTTRSWRDWGIPESASEEAILPGGGGGSEGDETEVRACFTAEGRSDTSASDGPRKGVGNGRRPRPLVAEMVCRRERGQDGTAGQVGSEPRDGTDRPDMLARARGRR